MPNGLASPLFDGAQMRPFAAVAAFVMSSAVTGAALAQAPDCRVELTSTNTASHRNEIVVAPSSPVTLQVHCNGAAQPAYRWTGGQTTPSINVTAPSEQGTQQAYGV